MVPVAALLHRRRRIALRFHHLHHAGQAAVPVHLRLDLLQVAGAPQDPLGHHLRVPRIRLLEQEVEGNQYSRNRELCTGPPHPSRKRFGLGQD